MYTDFIGFAADMKNYDIDIVLLNKHKVSFNVYEPETESEAMNGLANMQIKDNQGMIFFPVPNSPCINAQWITTERITFPTDFVFMDWNGTIIEIIDNITETLPICFMNPKAVCALQLKAGTCAEFNICVGDNVLHPKLYRLPDNRIDFKELAFKGIVKDSYDEIDQVVAFAYIYPKAILVFTKSDIFYLDEANYDYDKVCQIFPLWSEIRKRYFDKHPDWDIYIVDDAGQLFINHEYNTLFTKKLGKFDRMPKNWCKVLASVIKNK